MTPWSETETWASSDDTDPWARGDRWGDFGEASPPAERQVPELDASDEQVQSFLDSNDQHQAHGLRKTFFWVITSLLIVTVAGSVGVMVAYIISSWGDIKSEVMVSWFAAVVANTIGLAVVIAKYLFPGARLKKRRRKDK